MIDLDATDDPTYGQQGFEFYHAYHVYYVYYGSHCYLPLIGFCSCDEADEELFLRRPSSRERSYMSSVCRFSRLKEAFPTTEIVFRADAGFVLAEMYETCEKLGLWYFISSQQREASGQSV